MAKIYTKTGDKGTTGLVDGSRVSKSNPRIDALGTFDEINALIGFLTVLVPEDHEAHALLHKAQSFLFACGSRIAEVTEESSLPIVLPDESVVKEYEVSIDAMTKQLPPLTNFILPGGTELAARAHVVRAVVRRGERCLVAIKDNGGYVDPLILQFVNRLSDWFFTLARYFNHEAGAPEWVWGKEKQ